MLLTGIAPGPRIPPHSNLVAWNFAGTQPSSTYTVAVSRNGAWISEVLNVELELTGSIELCVLIARDNDDRPHETSKC
jgi:hypothetical protein